MNKPLLALAGLIALGGVGVGAYVVASPGGEEEAVQQVETATPAVTFVPTPTLPAITPGPGVTLYRWVNVTVLIPDGTGIQAYPNFAGARDGDIVDFSIFKVDPEDSRIISEVLVDAENGVILEESVLDQHRSDIDLVLATVSVSPFDPALAPWPYNGEPTPDLVRENKGGISYVLPSPASGLYIGGGIGDPGGAYITLRNQRSIAFIHLERPGGLVFETSAVDEEDKLVFERWLAAIKQCGAEIEC